MAQVLKSRDSISVGFVSAKAKVNNKIFGSKRTSECVLCVRLNVYIVYSEL